VDVATHGGYYVEESGKTIYGTSFATARLTGGVIAATIVASPKGYYSLTKEELLHNGILYKELSEYIVDGKMVETNEGR